MDFLESNTVELKEIINNDFKKEIVAFANTNGGEIYVGVDNKGNVVGIDNIEKEMERISSMIRDGIKPDLIPFTSIEAINVDGKNVICVSVSRGGKIPYHLTDKGMKPSGVYVRHGVASIPASEEMIRDMIKQNDGTTFDKARSINQELTFEFAEKFFKKYGVPFAYENKRTLGLIDADGFYTNAALLLSDQCEHSIKCAIFSGVGKTRFQAREEFHGSILEQLEEAYRYIELSNRNPATIEGLQRVERLDYPKSAVREALLNAIVHRDYNYSGSIIVNIFEDRMEYVSIGGLVKGITMADIMHGVSQSRNMVIANIFYRLELIESYGTGIQRILESYEGLKQPMFKVEPASFVTVLPNRNYFCGIVSDHKPVMLSPNEARVLSLFSDEKQLISRKDVEEVLGTSSFPANKILRSLVIKGKIKMLGVGKSTRYVLIEDGE
ncbi:MAG: putative DNA binding domain-containing protein [Phascolarctobacterium sp.]|nr:putative DNA binding domain-containing protein [Phascolarctobacterium sp.]